MTTGTVCHEELVEICETIFAEAEEIVGVILRVENSDFFGVWDSRLHDEKRAGMSCPSNYYTESGVS
jgi:hypothetical protein